MGLWILLFVIGAIGGFLVGMLGIGGGLVYIAVLHTVFATFALEGFEATRFILANALLVQAFAGTVAAYREHRTGLLHWREVLAVGIPAALISMPLSYLVKASNWYRREYFLAVFIVFLVYSVVRILRGSRAGAARDGAGGESWSWEHRPSQTYLFTGALTGIVSAFAGLGGGIFIIPWLSTRHKLLVKQAISIAIPAVVFGAFGNALVYMLGTTRSTLPVAHTGYIVWSVTLPMLAGVLIFTQLGVIVSTKVSTLMMKRLFALLLAAMALKLLFVDVLLKL